MVTSNEILESGAGDSKSFNVKATSNHLTAFGVAVDANPVVSCILVHVYDVIIMAHCHSFCKSMYLSGIMKRFKLCTHTCKTALVWLLFLFALRMVVQA